MTKRKTLSALVGDEARKPVTTKRIESPPAQPPTQNSVTTKRTESIISVKPKLQTPERTESVRSEEVVPKYLQLVRKESRLREDQVEALTMLARRLNRQKKGGERITENTLIRVAIDLLLAHSDQLTGTTEQELQDSIAPKADRTTRPDSGKRRRLSSAKGSVYETEKIGR